ncbi:MAG: UDP-N-acetylmuramoyl-L-alanine--D-glutamate ligase [Bacteroidaceae bacterium]|nr:UDP-N-acetylmuramoyl-L-alanine--D-glutamate ligase [Bacteroidaceae bacterium]
MAQKSITVLGAGESGTGAAILALKKGFKVFVSDLSEIKPFYKEQLEKYGIEWEEKHHSEERILASDEIIKSPGIPKEAPIIQKLMAQGTPVISEIEFAGRYTNARMICITGSNGKTTTTSLIYHIFKMAGMNVGLAGNIGSSLALQVAEKDYDWYVIELSSFQLDNMYDFKADIAVLMNITPDHLDRYDHNMQNYVDAKMRVIRNQTGSDAFVYWADDPIITRELKKYGLQATLYPFAEAKREDFAAWTQDGEVHFDRPTAFNMELESLSLRGRHNLYNSMAAGISASIAGIRSETIRKALETFEGVEHRLERVARVNGIDFINDSKATNVNSCWYALQSMPVKCVLILGGKDKGNDYTEIEPLVREKCVGLVYMGLHNEKLHSFFDPMGLPVADVQSMNDAVNAAYHMAKKGEIVLLSPCCASFDLFQSYEDRGRQFKDCVRKL